MLAHPADVDPVAAVGDDLAHRLAGNEARSLLVDQDALDRLGAADTPRIGRDLAGQQAEQGGLAGAVGADHADPVAALDAQAEVLDQRPLAERLGDVLGVDHHLGLGIVGDGGELCHADRAGHRLAQRAQLMELAKPAHVALAPCGDAAFEPVLFGAQLGVELVGVLGLFGIDRLGPRLEPAEADLGAPHGAAVEPQRRLGQPRQEHPVVADRDEAPSKPLQPRFEPLDRGDVEVVGRLVEQQHLGLLRQRAGDRRATLLAAARGRTRPVEVDAELVGDSFDNIGFRRIITVQREVAQRSVGDNRRILVEQDDARSGSDRAATLVDLGPAGEDLEQRRLACTVAPDQRQPVALADREVEAAQQPAGALDEADVFECEDGSCHGGDVGDLGRRVTPCPAMLPA